SIANGIKTVGWIFRQHATDCFLDMIGKVTLDHFAQEWRRRLHVRHHHLERGFTLKGRSAGEKPEEHTAPRILVGARVYRLTQRLLRTHIGGAAENLPRLSHFD